MTRLLYVKRNSVWENRIQNSNLIVYVASRSLAPKERWISLREVHVYLPIYANGRTFVCTGEKKKQNWLNSD